ncbi:MAG TPA: hypothetical protein VMV94_03060 [Phycisphaerae bacterium]|nr:hypothetical protein [Phycisphaerae bacterium]
MPSTRSVAAAGTFAAMLGFGPFASVAADSSTGKLNTLLVADDMGYFLPDVKAQKWTT